MQNGSDGRFYVRVNEIVALVEQGHVSRPGEGIGEAVAEIELRPVAAARKHQVLDAWTWERSRLPADADAAPLVAVTGAHALYAQYARVTVSDPLQNIW